MPVPSVRLNALSLLEDDRKERNYRNRKQREAAQRGRFAADDRKQQFYDALNARLEQAGPLPGMPVAPVYAEPQPGWGYEQPLGAPAINDPARDMAPLGRPPATLTRQEIEGDPSQAPTVEGVGGPQKPAGPWTKYAQPQQQEQAQAGPWQKYQTEQPSAFEEARALPSGEESPWTDPANRPTPAQPQKSDRLSEQLLNEAGADFMRGAGKPVTDLGGLADLGAAAGKAAVGAPLAVWDWATGEKPVGEKADDLGRLVIEGSGAGQIARMQGRGDLVGTPNQPGYDPSADATAFALNAMTFGIPRSIGGRAPVDLSPSPGQAAEYAANQLTLGGYGVGKAGVGAAADAAKSFAADRTATAGARQSLTGVLDPASPKTAKVAKGIVGFLRDAGVDPNRIAAGLNKVSQDFLGGSQPRLDLASLLEREFAPDFPKVRQNVRNFLLYAGLDPKIAQDVVVRAIDDLRGTQADAFRTTVRTELGDQPRADAEKQITGSLKQIGKEGYQPILKSGDDAPMGHYQELVETVQAHPLAARLLGSDARTQGMSIDQFIEQKPYTAAHLLRSALDEARRSATGADKVGLGGEVRLFDSFLDQLPGYKENKTAFAKEAKARSALGYTTEAGKYRPGMGDKLLGDARSEYKSEKLGEKYEGYDPRQAQAADLSIRDALTDPLRGGRMTGVETVDGRTFDVAGGRMNTLMQEGVGETLPRILGPRGERLVNALQEFVTERQRLADFDPRTGSNTTNKLLAVGEGPRAFSNALGRQFTGDPGVGMSPMIDAALMATGNLPLATMLAKGPNVLKKLVQPRRGTQRAITENLLRRPDDRTPPRTPPPPIGPQGPPAAAKGPPKSGTGEGARPASGASEEYIDVYHASPHDFDQFEFSPRTSKTGEGNQTFGPGLYFSENPATHAAYMERLGKGKTTGYEARLRVKRDELIDHDKFLSDQPKLKQAIMELSGNPVMGTRLANMKEWVDALDYLRRANGWNEQQLIDALKSKGFKGYQYLDAGSRQKGAGTRNYVIFDDKVVETTRKNKPEPAQVSSPTPKGEGKGPPRNALRDETRGPRQRLNTRSSIKDAPKEYRDVVMNAPEGYAQSVWDSVRKSAGSRLPGPYLLNNRIEALQRQPSRSAAEQRTLDALKEMKRRLEKLDLDYE